MSYHSTLFNARLSILVQHPPYWITNMRMSMELRLARHATMSSDWRANTMRGMECP